MERGFKARAEELSEEIRNHLGLRIDEALPARKLAEYLGARVMGVEDIPGLGRTDVSWLLNGSASEWSAFTLAVGGKTFIVHKTSHARTRQESDLMHELAHILCKHSPDEERQFDDPVLRHYNQNEEEEATWLGAVLQIPCKALLMLSRKSWTIDQIARHFGASVDLARFRYNKCGVNARLRRERRASRQKHS